MADPNSNIPSNPIVAMGMRYNKEIILKKIKENIPVIDIGIGNLDDIDQDSDTLFFANQRVDSIENIFRDNQK